MSWSKRAVAGGSSQGRCLASPASCDSSTRYGHGATTGPYPNDFEAAIFGHSLKTYGWVYFIVAIILLGSSFGVVVGTNSAVGSESSPAAILAISSIWWMPYYPIWSLTYIGIGVLVVYGLVAYGGRDAVEGTRRV